MAKFELQQKDNPRIRITVCTPQQVHDLRKHGWERVPVTVTSAPANSGAATKTRAEGGS